MSAGGTPGWCEMFSWGGRVEEMEREGRREEVNRKEEGRQRG